MCEIKDAQRYEEIAKLQEKKKELASARINYLEAASIYVLQAHMQHDDSLLTNANQCYSKAQGCIGKKVASPLSKEQLAHITVHELNSHHHDALALLHEEVESHVR